MKQGCIAIVVGSLLLVIVVSVMGAVGGNTTASVARTPGRSDACFMSQKFVKQSLKSPTSAEFPAWTEANCKVKQAAGTWIVTSYVDAQNSFGAMIRSDYVVQMTHSAGNDTWTLVDIAIIGP